MLYYTVAFCQQVQAKPVVLLLAYKTKTKIRGQHPGNLYRRTFGDVESLELDGLSVVDHGREVRVCVGRRAGVPVVGHQRRFFLGRQTRTCRAARPRRQRHLQH